MQESEKSNGNIVFQSFVLGDWMTNAYFIGDSERKTGWVFDPGFSPGELLGYLEAEAWEVEKILFTHAHLDHIAGAGELKDRFPGAEILIHKNEAAFLGDPVLNLSSMVGMKITAPAAGRLLADGETVSGGKLSCQVLHTPGHSPGGVCYWFSELSLLISGDTLFQGSVGRYDFPGSDGEQLFLSIKEKLLCLPENASVYPGHGAETTIAREKRSNPYLM